MDEFKEAARLQELVNKPAPTTGVVIGLGPSMKWFKKCNHRDDYCIALNEAIEHVDADAVLYVDEHNKDMVVPDGVDIIRSKQNKFYHDGRGYYFSLSPDNIKNHRADLANSEIYRGSLCYALWVFSVWSVKRIVVYGCDNYGTGNEDIAVDRRFPFQPKAYNKISKSAERVIEIHNLDVSFVHLDENFVEPSTGP